MTDTNGAPSPPSGVHFQLSPLLIVSGVAGIATTIGVAVCAVLANPPGPPNGPDGAPPPHPPNETALIIAVGLFVVAWLAVLVALARDQVMRRFTDLHARTAAQIQQYGDDRDTEGYLRALRTAAPQQSGEVRSLHRVLPPAD